MLSLRCPSAVFMLVLLLADALTVAARAVELKSPDGRIVVGFELKTIDGADGCPTYRVAFDGRPVLVESRFGLQLSDGDLSQDFTVVDQRTRSADTRWRPVVGERDTVRDHFNELVIALRNSSGRQLQLTFRAYDEGVAFCYTLPAAGAVRDFVITRELSQFAFAGDDTTWAVYRAQGNYDGTDPRKQPKDTKTGPVRLSELKPGVERPLTVRVGNDRGGIPAPTETRDTGAGTPPSRPDVYAAVTEARLVDYARMKLRPVAGRSTAVEAYLDAERGMYGQVTGRVPFTTPWRVVMLADSPGKLLEQDYLVLNLNDPCALADTSWIKPGKVIRDGSLTTAGGKACVDFAVSHGLQYVEYDAGWYGAETDPKSDARDVHLDPKRNPVPDSLNLHDVIGYAKSRGIGVILYVNHIALERQIDEILPLYERWGVAGVKYGFVNVGSQRWTAWLHEAVRKAAQHHLMVDIHDEFRSTGYQRTYPNLMTVEGVAGNEEFPTPVHNATLPFTRFLTGPADYTYCWNDVRLKVTKAHQLALSTINFSPWQFLYWYAKPAGVPEEPALDYWRALPTSWDDTRVLAGDIGRRAVVARRKGLTWFVGAIAPVDGKFPIALDFLPANASFAAKLYSDGPNGAVRVEERQVDARTVLNADIPANGGLAVLVTPR